MPPVMELWPAMLVPAWDHKGKAASEEAASLTNQGKGTGTKGS